MTPAFNGFLVAGVVSLLSWIYNNIHKLCSSTCVVLALVAGRQDRQPRPNSQQQTPLLLSQQLVSQRLYCP